MNNSKYKCNLIVPGFAKCGTSSLHEYLDQHPRIQMSRPKEPHHFAFADKYARGADIHNKLFKNSQNDTMCFGDSSTSYAVWEPAISRIAEVLDEPKAIVLIRHPIERLLSHYRWMYRIGNETERLETAVRQEIENGYDINCHRRGCYPWYLRHSQYSTFCPTICEKLGKENTLFIKTSILSKNPEAVFKKIFRFIEVPNHPINFRSLHNTTDSQSPIVPPKLREQYSRVPRILRRAFRSTRLTQFTRKIVARRPNAPEPTTNELALVTQQLSADIDFFMKQPDCFVSSEMRR
ncbi:Sulfotransferase domain protein [Rosistilla oblonga]|uniref:sulfotransferase domain-containing protein n=1 Tax=Rosistilla oblonga TaxID=2527990 RepID=UPI001188A3F6|nr:sulfotransferase domain-containing protein [Rosistilla oblonga]QDV12563.1 Sulfotransferase domain protein [Rosistilla oblonga]